MQIIQRKKFVINAKCCFKNSQQFFAQSYQCDRILFYFNSGHAEQTNAVIFCTTIHSVFRTCIAYLYCSLFLQGEEIKKWTSNSGNSQTRFFYLPYFKSCCLEQGKNIFKIFHNQLHHKISTVKCNSSHLCVGV